MMLAIVTVLGSLLLVLALNWRQLNALGSTRVAQMLGLWALILLGLFLLLRFLGY